MTVDIEYDVITHTFFCDGHVSDDEFLESLWEQWESDYCQPQFDPNFRWTYARFVRGSPGYWKETKAKTKGTKPITAISGSVINLGPLACPTCESLMMMHEKGCDDAFEHESWECGNCRTKVGVTRPR